MKKQNNKTDKLTNKAFSRLMLTSVLSILACVICLCSATWAWFSTDVSVSGNTLASGRFGLDVSVDDAAVTVTESANGNTVCTFDEAKPYTVKLQMTEDTTVAKGFCIIHANGSSYYTASIHADDEDPFIILDVKEAGMTVTFSPTWGLPAQVDVEIGETLAIGSVEAPAE